MYCCHVVVSALCADILYLRFAQIYCCKSVLGLLPIANQRSERSNIIMRLRDVAISRLARPEGEKSVWQMEITFVLTHGFIRASFDTILTTRGFIRAFKIIHSFSVSTYTCILANLQV